MKEKSEELTTVKEKTVIEPSANSTAEQLYRYPMPCVYCGPTVRSVARQYTVYTTALPAPLVDFLAEHPVAKHLLVSTVQFADMRKRLETAGTTEYILYKKLQEELNKKG